MKDEQFVMTIPEDLGQTRRSFIHKLMGGAFVISGSIKAEAEDRGSCEEFVIVNGWLLTNKDTQYQQDLSMHDF